MVATQFLRILDTLSPVRDLGFERLHFIGAGGVGMSAVAQGVLHEGLCVTGSDLQSNEYTELLKSNGMAVHVGHAAEQVGDAQAVVVSSAISGRNPELLRARECGLPILHRSEVLAALLSSRQSVCVAGSHGKTTVTAMVGLAMEASGFDPTVFVGGFVEDFGGNVRFGERPFAVAEADESDGSFLRLPADVVAVTNIESEHLEYWGDEDQLMSGFRRFLKGVRPGGYAVVNHDDPGVRKMLRGAGVPVLTSSVQSEVANFAARTIDLGLYESTFEFLYEGLSLGRIRLHVPGLHNVSNATLALGVVLGLGGDFDRMVDALAAFRGVGRRFQRLGEEKGVLVIDDYAHHPTEAAAALASARRIADTRGGRLIALFQPHRYTRTSRLLDRFSGAFGACDIVVVTEVYGAGEAPIENVTGRTVAENIAASGYADVDFLSTLEESVESIVMHARPGDVLVTVGAGDVCKAGQAVLAALAGHRRPGGSISGDSSSPPEVPPCR